MIRPEQWSTMSSCQFLFGLLAIRCIDQNAECMIADPGHGQIVADGLGETDRPDSRIQGIGGAQAQLGLQLIVFVQADHQNGQAGAVVALGGFLPQQVKKGLAIEQCR